MTRRITIISVPRERTTTALGGQATMHGEDSRCSWVESKHP